MATNFAKMDKKAYNAFCKDVTDALEAVAKKHGVTFKLGNGRYDPSGCSLKTSLEIATVGDDGAVVDQYAIDYKRYAEMVGLKVEWLGKVFTDFTGKKYTITGYNSRRSAKPVFAKGEDGKTYAWPTKAITHFMGGK